jgi:hypothetical protein
VAKVSLSTVQTYLADLISQTGLPVYITEMDPGTPDDVQQTSMMKDLVTTFWNEPNVPGITYWVMVASCGPKVSSNEANSVQRINVCRTEFPLPAGAEFALQATPPVHRRGIGCRPRQPAMTRVLPCAHPCRREGDSHGAARSWREGGIGTRNDSRGLRGYSAPRRLSDSMKSPLPAALVKGEPERQPDRELPGRHVDSLSGCRQGRL